MCNEINFFLLVKQYYDISKMYNGDSNGEIPTLL